MKTLLIGKTASAWIRHRAWLGAFGLLSFAPAVAVQAAEWVPDASIPNPQLHKRLYDVGRHYGDENFDPVVNMVHQKPKDHVVVQSATYAYGLLLTGDPADRDRAVAVLRKVISTQDTRPKSEWRGEFPWTSEQDWATIKNPDLNGATFVGSTLAAVFDLDAKHPCLPADFRQMVKEAGILSAEEVLRRDVDPGYTNIALQSTAFMAAADKLWAVPGAREYARKKLDAVMKLADGGAFYEYLAPTYLSLDLGAAYNIRKYAFSDEFSARGDELINHLWKEIALSYHAPTYQLSGPNNRSYGDNMLEYSAGLKYWLYLALDGNYPIPDSEKDHAWDQLGLMGLAAIPIGTRSEFQQTPPEWREITVVGPEDGAHPTRNLFQYRHDNFVLGTVAFQDEWKQKRNLVAYWRNPGPAPLNMSVGFCIDQSNETLPNGFPYAQIHFDSKQVKDAAVVALSTRRAVPDKGECALVFDSGASAGEPAASGLVVKDGTITTYLYPLTTGSATFKSQSDGQRFRATRGWDTADVVGNLHVLSYLVVFRAADQPAPAVSDLHLSAQDDGAVAHAVVDGNDLTVSFK